MPPQSDASIDLQLDHAEFAAKDGERCAACRQILAGSYYEIGGRLYCASCHGLLAAKLSARPGASGFLRATGAGLGGAAAGAASYFVVRLATGYDFSLISILVGFMVGKAVQWGARGHGGWLYQTLAVLLTYLAIVSVYIPQILANVRRHDEAQATTTSSIGSAAATDDRTAQTPQRAPRSPGALAATGLLLLALAAVVPFLGGVNVLGLFIIAIGLFQAWKLNRRPTIKISGPHSIAPPGWRT